jgi:hypothetical protein
MIYGYARVSTDGQSGFAGRGNGADIDDGAVAARANTDRIPQIDRFAMFEQQLLVLGWHRAIDQPIPSGRERIRRMRFDRVDALREEDADIS